MTIQDKATTTHLLDVVVLYCSTTDGMLSSGYGAQLEKKKRRGVWIAFFGLGLRPASYCCC